jgi:hypothetical protein
MKPGKIILGLCLGLCSISLLSGCVMLSKEHMSAGSTDYNLVVEKASNEMLLLNIVRASKRHPMYFTNFNALRANMTFNIQTGSMTTPYAKMGKGPLAAFDTVAPSAAFSTSPSYDLTVLDSQEFYTGIMTPVSMDLFNYYWEQGWPKEMLLYLFIRRIEHLPEDGKPEVPPLENYPGNKIKFDKFKQGLHKLFFANDQTDQKSECSLVAHPDIIGTEIKKDDVQNLKNLIELQKVDSEVSANHGKNMRLEINKNKTTYQLISTKYIYKFDCGKAKYKFYLRSPEQILYYLGEIIREEMKSNSGPHKIHVCDDNPSVEAPLFVVNKQTGNDGNSSVNVVYEGIKYIIPDDSANTDSCRVDRSMHVLSLVTQLIGLQKKGSKTPVTSVVTITGTQ